MSEVEREAQDAARLRAEETSATTRRARGIVATPGELARHAVARIDALLRSDLGLADGVASEQVVALDPSVGTGVWLAALLSLTRECGTRATLIGVDVDEGALASARALLEPEARAQAASLTLRCDNTLALAAPFSDRSRVRVVLGNPPWAARSLSRGSALSDAWLAEFRRDHEGRALGERRLGVLSDDYVRFFRWALEQARTGEGGSVVCLATNGSFLDGPIHRGMRAALSRAFDRIEVLDLGGNALLSRGDERDDNVFGVRVGAALTWAVRRAGAHERRARVSFTRLTGSRVHKLALLASGSALPTVEHAPDAPWFRFVPPRAREQTRERDGFSLAEAFPFQREGVQTNRDALAIADDEDTLRARLMAIVRGEIVLPSSAHFDPERARILLSDALSASTLRIEPLAYRPLDTRVFAALAPFCHRPRSELLDAVQRSTRCLYTVRKERGAAAFNLFAPGRLAADACYLSTRSSCRTRVFPSHGPDGAENLAPGIAARLAAAIGRAVSSGELLDHAVAVLGSPRFRAAHEHALKEDYARLPWPRDHAALVRAGEIARAFTHALEAPVLDAAPVRLAPCVDEQTPLPRGKLTYAASERVISLGARALLTDVDPALWAMSVGHHRLATATLTRALSPCVRHLIAGLARAAAWQRAERAADLAFDER